MSYKTYHGLTIKKDKKLAILVITNVCIIFLGCCDRASVCFIFLCRERVKRVYYLFCVVNV